MQKFAVQRIMSVDENRTFDRVVFWETEVPVRYRGDTNGLIRGYVLDISRGGMFVVTNAAQKVGAYIMADIDVAEFGKVIWAQGRVIRSTGFGVGIKFTHIDAKGIDAIVQTYRSKG